MNWPYAMDMNNLYLFRLNESMNRFEIKAIPMLDYILKPTYKDKNRDLLLDSIILNCTSEEDLFDSIMRCVSPLGFLGQKNRIEDLKN